MVNDKTIYRKQFGNFHICAGFNLTKEPVRRRSEPNHCIHISKLLVDSMWRLLFQFKIHITRHAWDTSGLILKQLQTFILIRKHH